VDHPLRRVVPLVIVAAIARSTALSTAWKREHPVR
jgi:hypothetical protein